VSGFPALLKFGMRDLIVLLAHITVVVFRTSRPGGLRSVIRLNGLLLTAGDRMVARLGLTSTRWQVLRAIAFAERAQPVAWLARDMGGNRQNVQRIVNDLQKMGS